MVVAYIFSLRKHHPKSLERFYVKNFVKSFVLTFPALLMPIIILGGILSGAFTPTEASATAAAYGLFAGTVIYRTLTLHKIIESFFRASVTSSVILLVIAVSNPFGHIVTFLHVPEIVGNIIVSISSNLAIILALIMIFLLFMVLLWRVLRS